MVIGTCEMLVMGLGIGVVLPCYDLVNFLLRVPRNFLGDVAKESHGGGVGRTFGYLHAMTFVGCCRFEGDAPGPLWTTSGAAWSSSAACHFHEV